MIKTDLTAMFDAQRKLQVALGNDVTTMSPPQLMNYIRTMVLACDDELHEALNETGWKPWASSNHINPNAFKDELTDAFLFLLNLMLAGGMTAGDLANRYPEKRANAEKRMLNGYDGVLTKCPICKRAYDNKAVECYPAIPGIPDNGDGKSRPATPAWCSRKALMEVTATPDEPHCPQCRGVYGDDSKCHPASDRGFGWCDKFRQSLVLIDAEHFVVGGERVA
jgi:hypothetical protein